MGAVDPRCVALAVASMTTRDDLHRTLKLELDQGRAETVEAAEELTRAYRLGVVVSDEVGSSATRQAALLTILNAATRAFRGGVVVDGDLDWPVLVGWGFGRPMIDVASNLGAEIGPVDDGRPVVIIGDTADHAATGDVAVEVTWNGWSGGVVPVGGTHLPEEVENPLAGVLAGSLAVSETFAHVRGDVVAGRRTAGLSLWDLELDWLDPAGWGPELSLLPAGLWLLGLGHLGQAYLWAIGMLPYPDPSQVLLVLQDFDEVVEANRSTGLLVGDTVTNGTPKTRVAAGAMEGLGFTTRLVERPFDASTRPGPGEPRWALAGFDAAAPRRDLAAFDLAIDVGLGSAADDHLGLHLHSFPAAGDPTDVFTSGPAAARGDAVLSPWAVAAAVDRCGVLQLQSAAVGAAFVGAAAAAIAVAELLRVLAGAEPTAIAAASLNATDDVDVVRTGTVAVSNPGFVPAA